MGHAVEEEAEALGEVAQVGCLAVEQEEEEQPVELRVAQPGVGLLVRDTARARARARVRVRDRVRVGVGVLGVGLLRALELPDGEVVRAEGEEAWQRLDARWEAHVARPVHQVVEDLLVQSGDAALQRADEGELGVGIHPVGQQTGDVLDLLRGWGKKNGVRVRVRVS